ncbi:hypothetical protein GF351_01225 [Candidatus Woesearchaeota archaeon]|nr:hypothetical protein [Candidatus Woesearchaeota archaeon]
MPGQIVIDMTKGVKMITKGKRAQVQGQVLVYLLAVIMFGMLLLYGYNVINKIIEEGDRVALIQMKSDISSEINRVSFGDYKPVSFTVPGDFEEVCFLDNSQRGTGAADPVCDSTSLEYQPILCDSFSATREHIKDNMFLIDSIAQDVGYIGSFRMDHPYYNCIQVINREITFTLEGRGAEVYMITDEAG